MDGGCLLQLCNLLNWRNVAKDVTGCFNATIDFFELIVHCHILAAALHVFGMSETDETPSFNALPSNLSKWPVKEQWRVSSHAIGRLIDRYVIVNKFADLHPEPHIPRQLLSSLEDAPKSNPHAFRISVEHGYARSSVRNRLQGNEPCQVDLRDCLIVHKPHRKSCRKRQVFFSIMQVLC